MTNWSTINTAPKDGTQVLIGYAGENLWRQWAAYYHQNVGAWMDEDGQIISAADKATHWCAVPKPPEPD